MAIVLLLSVVAEIFHCDGDTVNGCDISDTRNSSTAYTLLYELVFKTHWGRDTFKRFFLTENVKISIKNSLKFVPKGTDQATSHYLNQWWSDHRRIYASLGLNELTRLWRSPCSVVRFVCHIEHMSRNTDRNLFVGDKRSYCSDTEHELCRHVQLIMTL